MRKLLVTAGLIGSAGIGTLPLGAAFAANPFPNGSSPGVAPVSAPAPVFNRANAVSGSAIVQYALKFLGYPYTATGNSPSTGFSCIGFVSYVYRLNGINLPGDLGGALAFAPRVAFANLQPGDILYFQNTVWAGLSHAAIYIGGGRFVHAEWYNRGVVTSSFTNDPVDGNYWTAHYLGANRPWTGAATTAPGVQRTPVTKATALTVPTALPKISPVTGSNRVIVPTPSAGPAKAATQLPGGPSAMVRVSSLNVRSGPSIRAAIYTVIRQGTKVILLRQQSGWYRVELPNGAIGWVIGAGIGRRNGSNRRNQADLPVPTSTPSAPPTPVRTTVARHTPARRAPGRPVTVQAISWHSSSSRALTTRRTTASKAPRAKVALNVRAGTTLSSRIIGIVVPGGAYQVLRWAHGWARVRFGQGSVGWMSGSVLTPSFTTSPSASGAATAVAPTRRSTVTASVRLHTSPTVQSAAVRLIPLGTHIQVLSTSAGWTRVRLSSSQTGYILGIYIK